MAERLMVQGFKEFIGKHCETTALKRVLDRHGISLSEEMLLGLGGGAGFIYSFFLSHSAYRLMPCPLTKMSPQSFSRAPSGTKDFIWPSKHVATGKTAKTSLL